MCVTEEMAQLSDVKKLCSKPGKAEEKEDGDEKAWISSGSGATAGTGVGMGRGSDGSPASSYTHTRFRKQMSRSSVSLELRPLLRRGGILLSKIKGLTQGLVLSGLLSTTILW